MTYVPEEWNNWGPGKRKIWWRAQTNPEMPGLPAFVYNGDKLPGEDTWQRGSSGCYWTLKPNPHRPAGEHLRWIVRSEEEQKIRQAQELAQDNQKAFLRSVTVEINGEQFFGETKSVSATGGVKGVKPARFDLLPPDALWLIAEAFGRGAAKYEDRNWEKGYELSKSYQALQRHIQQFWAGEDIDDGTGASHMALAATHALIMLALWLRFPEYDDRHKLNSKLDNYVSKEEGK